jgi:pimeloyl-ACP methyl ester carboxylesterase
MYPLNPSPYPNLTHVSGRRADELRDARIRTLRAAGEDIPVLVQGEGTRTVLFLHGFSRPPAHYEFLGDLAREHDCRVVAPFLYPNNRLKHPPETFAACVALTHAVIRAMAETGLLEDGYAVVGHSTGGTVALCLASARPAPGSVLALNPLLPVSYGPAGFAWRACAILRNQLLGRTVPVGRAWSHLLAHGSEVAANAMRRPLVTWRLVQDLSRFELSLLRALTDRSGRSGHRFAIPARLVYAERDEFFRLPADLPIWAGLVYEDFRAEIASGVRGHEWPALHREWTAARVARFLDEEERACNAA